MSDYLSYRVFGVGGWGSFEIQGADVAVTLYSSVEGCRSVG